jgi:putative FmdB family regulatory protein
MPLYEYECKECHRHTEKIQKFSDAEITTCPHCGGPLERVISAPAIAFKGGGWYKDGYSSATPSKSTSENSSDSGSAAGPSSDAPASPASDTKAAAPSTAPAPSAAASPSATSSPSADKK